MSFEPTQTTVLLVDDDPMVRGWLRLSLDGTEFRIAAEAGTREEAAELVRRRNPALLVVDLKLGRDIGTKLVRSLREQGITTPAVVMTANAERGLNEAARDAGAQGTLLKTGSQDELLETLRRVLTGQTAFDPRHPPRPRGRAALSPREREVLRLVAGGATNKEIASNLGVGEETVKTIVARMFTKLGVRRRAEAVTVAHEQGLL